MSFLDELFGQILLSEKKIKERFDQLKDAHSQILTYQSKLKDVSFDLQSHQGTIAVKNQKLIEQQVELKWLHSREEVIKIKIKETEEERERIIHKIAAVETEIISEREQFVDETKSFTKKNKISSCFETEYEKAMTAKLDILKKQKTDLEQELKPLKFYKEKTKKLKDKIDERNRSITAMILAKDEKQEELNLICKNMSIAILKKNNISSEPQTSLEFTRRIDEHRRCQNEANDLHRKKQKLLTELYRCQQQTKRSHKNVTAMKQNEISAEADQNHEQRFSKENNTRGRVNLFKTVYQNVTKHKS